MRILVCGDIVGRSGREVVLQHLCNLRERFCINFIILNVDNAAHGFGITGEIAKQFLENGADILTGGNHLFNQKGISGFLESEKRLLRPANLPSTVPGNGVFIVSEPDRPKIAVVHLIGQVNMPLIGENAFYYMDKFLASYHLGSDLQAIVIDFHAEVTSEKSALGHYLDGRVSAVVGTHTHIPTADDRILERGTAFQTDVGMCGDYDSVIGMQKSIIGKFVKGFSYQRMLPADGKATLCGTIIDIDDRTGLATSISTLRIDGHLRQLGQNYQ
ncbi:MAG: TIGR00282 family metallophosphoesterase [Holosporaceae bacterium]|jgi:metallophosphoesterase (TIGR00282 family)|nr:TIGR00282 family metallophosphoesterase [Holosporaceae bacterium]